MAGFKNMDEVVVLIANALTTSSGCNEWYYGVPAEVNDKHDRDYPVASIYPLNTTIPYPMNLSRGQVQVATTFEIFVFYNWGGKNMDDEPNVILKIIHSQSQGIITEALKVIFEEIENDNFDIIYTPTGSTDIIFFEQYGTDLVAGAKFTLTLSYYEDCLE